MGENGSILITALPKDCEDQISINLLKVPIMLSIKQLLYFFIKKKSEKEHRSYYPQKNRFYIDLYNNCKDKKSKNTVQKEIKILWKYWKVYPIQYFRYYMYRSDCKLSISEMKKYIPDYFAYYLLYPKSFLERNILCEDKLLFYAICKGLKIEQPKTIISTKEGQVLSETQNIITIEQAYGTIQRSPAKKIFCKPRFGVGGEDIRIFSRNEEYFINKDDNSILNCEYITDILKQDYLLQEGLIQHPIMNKIYPLAINTFRIVTEYIDGSNIKILFALLRMGHNGMEIDNASTGGLYMKIKIQNGELFKYAISNQQKQHSFHPYTGFKFEGFIIPFWNEILEFVKNAAFKFSEIKYIGWDIAYTIDGPAVIEANNGPGVSILQDCYGGIQDEFNIHSPKDFWFSKNYGLKDL